MASDRQHHADDGRERRGVEEGQLPFLDGPSWGDDGVSQEIEWSRAQQAVTRYEVMIQERERLVGRKRREPQ